MDNSGNHQEQELVSHNENKPLEIQSADKQETYQTEINENQSQVSNQQEIPDHFYDSDIASVCEKDFMSDNQPPKDIVQERKLLFKEKLLHVFKTIVRVGVGIDKPARYDKIKIKHRQVPKNEVKLYTKKNRKEKTQNCHKQNPKGELIQQKIDISKTLQANQKHFQQQQSNQTKQKQQQIENKEQNQDQTEQKPSQTKEQLIINQSMPKQQLKQSQIIQGNLAPYYSTAYVEQSPEIQYNIGNEYEQLQRMVVSMKRGETAVFQLQYLTVSKKSNIKIKAKTEIHVIHAFDWATVIDLDGEKKYLKYVLNKGEGAFRVALYDRIDFNYELKKHQITIQKKQFASQRLEKEFVETKLPRIVWRVLTSMKNKQKVKLEILNKDLQQNERQESFAQFQTIYNNLKTQQKLQNDHINEDHWVLTIEIANLIKVDDIFLDGRIIKETLIKGVSTAKPESSSLIYYALKFIDNQNNQLKKDECFDSDWWENFSKLDELKGIRKNYLDDHSMSKMLRKAIKRMKPAEIALVQCRDRELFQYGSDYRELKQLLKFEQTPKIVKIEIRLYNFTEGRTAFNMQIEEKILESKRKKQIALKLLGQNKIQKALKKFESIVALYSSQKINQQAYDQKISALMNAILCNMKLKKFTEMIGLCNEILLKPRHGYQSKDMKIVGPGNAKIQGSIDKLQEGEGQKQQTSTGDTRRIAADLVQNQKILDKCLYRKGFALVQIGECEQALKSLSKISLQMNSSEQVIKLRTQAEKGKQKYEQKSKKIFQNMFG